MLGALSASAAAADAKELAAKGAELKKLFEDGVAAGNAGRHDEAIEKFNAGVAINPKCYDCYDNIGFAHMQKKEYDKAEEAYKKAAEIKPDDAAAWNGLATVYNAQRKFDEASKASAKATELSTNLSATGGAGAGADAMYNQGVILWNAGKVAEAKKQFEAAVQANPEPRRGALSARDGARERGQPRRRRDRVRNVPEACARAGRTPPRRNRSSRS